MVSPTSVIDASGHLEWSYLSGGPESAILEGCIVVGRGLGYAPGCLAAPVSFDFGPDGWVYVLDAANARVGVFDAQGRYITQIGVSGPGPGQFDFGQGCSATDLRGSIAVDDQGFIYVADPGNQRIQKFAR